MKRVRSRSPATRASLAIDGLGLGASGRGARNHGHKEQQAAQANASAPIKTRAYSHHPPHDRPFKALRAVRPALAGLLPVPLAICAKIGLDLGANLNHGRLSDSCDPLRASAHRRLAKSPAIPVIRIRLAIRARALDAKRRYGRICFPRPWPIRTAEDAERSGGQVTAAAK